jgi:23S rRNA pseudouridine2605 synthase
VNTERLQKMLAGAGVASRRDCEELITAGRVTVNGQVVRELGTRVDIDHDTVALDGNPIHQPTERTYILLNKPVGVVSTADDPQDRPTVVDLVDVPVRLFPVGRLDMESEGLLLLTNDGELMHRLTHPRFEVEKEYRALLDRTPDAAALQAWRAGVDLDGERTAPAEVELLEETDGGAWVRVVLREGRKRQIRTVAQLLGYTVQQLIRVREDQLLLGELQPGQWRTLSAEEVVALRAHLTVGSERRRVDRARIDSAHAGSDRPSGQRGPRSQERERYGSGPDAQRSSRRTQREGSSWSRRSERSGTGGERRSDSRRDERSGSRRDGSRSSYQRDRTRDGGYSSRGEQRRPQSSRSSEVNGNQRVDPERSGTRSKPVPDRAWRERQDRERQQRNDRMDWRGARNRRDASRGSGGSNRSTTGGRYAASRRPKERRDEYENEA